MDIGRIERAWAAGFFDGEGWAGSSGRGVLAQINQADPDGMPEALRRFQRAAEIGRLGGPVLEEGKEPLYRWVVSSRADVLATFERLSPWLGAVKRKEFEDALRISGPASEWESAPVEERTAWAAGLFDGEGWTGSYAHRSHFGRLIAEMGLTQDGGQRSGTPEVLLRFREIVGCGRTYGPYEVKSGKNVYRWKAYRFADVRAAFGTLASNLGTPKREQALRTIDVVGSQQPLPRGNPAWGAYKTRCVNGHEYAVARLRPYRPRKTGAQQRRDSKQCLTCSRDQARARRQRKKTLGLRPSSRSTRG